MKKLIVVLAIVLGFVFAAPGFAFMEHKFRSVPPTSEELARAAKYLATQKTKTVYYGCVDEVESYGYNIVYGKIRIVKDFEDVRCKTAILRPNHLFKMILIDIESIGKMADGKENRCHDYTEIECKQILKGGKRK